MFMLENCSELKKPCARRRADDERDRRGRVDGREGADRRADHQRVTVEHRPAKRRRMGELIVFVVAAATVGIISNPDCRAGRPSANW